MPKKRKTRKQKMQASTRHHTVTATPVSSEQTDIKIPERFTFIQPKQAAATATMYPHEYLKPELRKIAYLSAGIVVCELILFFLLQNHLVALPGLFY